MQPELGALLAHYARRGTDLVATLRSCLDAGRSKARTVGALHLSRPAVDARLATNARVHDADLDAVETSPSLHVALIAQTATSDRADRRG